MAKYKVSVGGEEVEMNVRVRCGHANVDYAVGTNGEHGGDYGHGGRSVIVIRMEGTVLASLSDKWQRGDLDSGIEFMDPADGTGAMTLRIVTGGDDETRALAEVFSDIGNSLMSRISKKPVHIVT